MLLTSTLSLAAAACLAVADPSHTEEGSIEDALVRIDQDARDGDNPYLGTARVERLHAELAGLTGTGDKDARKRWRAYLSLGEDQLRLGEPSEALESFEASARELEQFAAKRANRAETSFFLGLANLRLGELANCCQRHTPESCLMPIAGAGVHTDPTGSRAALAHFAEALAVARPGSRISLRARWLMNIAAMTLDEWPAAIPEDQRLDESLFATESEFPRFPQLGSELGLTGTDLAGGMAIEDFDGDGWLDVLSSTSDTGGAMKLFLNDRTGGFERKDDAGLERQLGGLNLIHADYDNDGDVDVLVLRGAWWQEFGAHPNSLLQNRGDGSFVDVTRAAGLADPFRPTQTAAWADYDNDGDLDLYVGNESPRKPRYPNQLFQNQGDGTFVDVTKSAGVRNNRYTKGVTWGDFDDDGFQDLYVSNMGDENRLYRNQGDGTFVDIAKELRVHRPISGFPCWFFDYDNDGRLDLFASAYGGPKTEPDIADVAASYFGLQPEGEMDRLYRNTSEGFVTASADLGLDRYTLPMGANFGDVDGDGWLDFFLGTGYPSYAGLMPNLMFRNDAGRGFVDVTFAGGFGHLQKGHGVAFADYDKDGDLDVFEQIGGAFPGDAFSNAIWQNPGFEHHWIEIRAVGVQSNRSAIGTRVRVLVREGETTRDIYCTIGSGGSFGANPLMAWVGLGMSETIEELEVRWPAGDLTQRFENVEMDRAYRLVEGIDELVPAKTALPE